MPFRYLRGFVARGLKPHKSYLGKPRTREEELQLTRGDGLAVHNRMKVVKPKIMWEHGKQGKQVVGYITNAEYDYDTHDISCDLAVEENGAGLALLQMIDAGREYELSLSHYLETNEPIEVSLCEKGAREGCKIVGEYKFDTSKCEMHISNDTPSSSIVCASAEQGIVSPVFSLPSTAMSFAYDPRSGVAPAGQLASAFSHFNAYAQSAIAPPHQMVSAAATPPLSNPLSPPSQQPVPPPASAAPPPAVKQEPVGQDPNNAAQAAPFDMNTIEALQKSNMSVDAKIGISNFMSGLLQQNEEMKHALKAADSKVSQTEKAAKDHRKMLGQLLYQFVSKVAPDPVHVTPNAAQKFMDTFDNGEADSFMQSYAGQRLVEASTAVSDFLSQRQSTPSPAPYSPPAQPGYTQVQASSQALVSYQQPDRSHDLARSTHTLSYLLAESTRNLIAGQQQGRYSVPSLHHTANHATPQQYPPQQQLHQVNASSAAAVPSGMPSEGVDPRALKCMEAGLHPDLWRDAVGLYDVGADNVKAQMRSREAKRSRVEFPQ